jgi:hypothetical protein
MADQRSNQDEDVSGTIDTERKQKAVAGDRGAFTPDREQGTRGISAAGRVAGEPDTSPARAAEEGGDHEMGHGGMLGAPTADAPPPGSPEAETGERRAGGGKHDGPEPTRQ